MMFYSMMSVALSSHIIVQGGTKESGIFHFHSGKCTQLQVQFG